MENAVLIGLSRQIALHRELEVVANNIANLDTTGYKADGSVFHEFLMPIARAGRFQGNDQRLSYVHDRATWHNFSAGPTRRPAIRSTSRSTATPSWWCRPPRGERYTRNGALQINATGELVTCDRRSRARRRRADPVPVHDNNISINPDGTITVREGGNATSDSARGKLRLVRFDAVQTLLKDGSSHVPRAGRHRAAAGDATCASCRARSSSRTCARHRDGAHDRADAHLHPDRRTCCSRRTSIAATPSRSSPKFRPERTETSMRALHTAATGMMAQELNVQVISNNIANMRTTGYKRQRAEFQDLLYEHVSRVGTQTSTQGNILPVGIDLGGGVKTVGTPRIMTQGTISPTGKDFDVAIRGDGFFKILSRTAPSPIPATARSRWTRRAASSPPRATSCSPASPSRRTRRRSPSTRRARCRRPWRAPPTPTVLGQLTLTRFVNKAGLQPIGDNLFLETPASGTPQDGQANTDGFGDLQQGNLEQANVEAVTEISDLIAAQRAYEMNAKVISAADQMLQSTSAMIR